MRVLDGIPFVCYLCSYVCVCVCFHICAYMQHMCTCSGLWIPHTVVLTPLNCAVSHCGLTVLNCTVSRCPAQPTNKDYTLPAGELPPLLVQIHGGPTARTGVAYSLGKQYWTSRGEGLDEGMRGLRVSAGGGGVNVACGCLLLCVAWRCYL